MPAGEKGLEPSVTGLAATALVQKYARPAFLFIEQGDDLIGSGRGTPDVDLFMWIERHQELLVKFGGHQAAVGLTVKKSDFPALREGLFRAAQKRDPALAKKPVQPEAEICIDEANQGWWESLQALEPFGQGFEMPVFELRDVDSVTLRSNRSQTKVMLKRGAFSWPGEWGALPHSQPYSLSGEGGEARMRQSVIATPQATPKEELPFKWIVHP